MLAYDLVSGKTLWRHDYPTGVDNIAITPNGRRIYLAVGEASNSTAWEIVDAANGQIIGSVQGGSGPHETIIGPGGKYVYLGGVNTPYLEVASTSSGRIVRKIGPLHGPGVRPFTIDATQTLAFTTSWNFLGFQVSSIKTGKVLYSVSPRHPDARVHDVLELPRLPGQQHQDGKGPVQRFPARVPVRPGNVRQHPRPRHLALPGRTSALPDRHT
jgi:DNA-binding beta-propeller fold protein YncE